MMSRKHVKNRVYQRTERKFLMPWQVYQEIKV